MRNATIDIAIILVVFLIAYARPCVMAKFFNTVVGRLLLLAGIVLLSTANTLWGILGVIVLVSFRENTMEGLENMDNDKDAKDDKKSDHQGKNKSDDGESDDDDDDDSKETKEVKPEEWRKQNCKADQAMLNGSAVSMDDFADKFPDVSFLSGKCNPCMSDCKIKVTSAAARLDAEDKVRAKNSNALPVA